MFLEYSGMVSRIILLCEKGEGQGSRGQSADPWWRQCSVCWYGIVVLVVFEDGVLKRRSANAERWRTYLPNTVQTNRKANASNLFIAQVPGITLLKLTTSLLESSRLWDRYEFVFLIRGWADGRDRTGSLRVRVYSNILNWSFWRTGLFDWIRIWWFVICSLFCIFNQIMSIIVNISWFYFNILNWWQITWNSKLTLIGKSWKTHPKFMGVTQRILKPLAPSVHCEFGLNIYPM